MHCNPNYLADVIPVDTAINGLIVAGWDRGQMKSDKAEFYNVVLSPDILRTWGENIEDGKRLLNENPLCFSLWYPDGSITSSYLRYMITIIFFQYLPAYLIDGLLFIFGQKPL